MLIILEGCDGSGKSTLAAELADTIKRRYPYDLVEVRHCGPLREGVHPLDAYERPLFDYRPGTGKHVIYDRHWMGEWIYPEVFGRTSVANTQTYLHIEMFLQSRGAVLVRTKPPIDELKRVLRERGDDLLDILQVEGVTEAYDRLFGGAKLPFVTVMSYGTSVVPAILKTAEEHEYVTKKLNPFVTYIGPHSPEYLLLGDVRHALSKVDLSALPLGATVSFGPAFGPHPGTSGEYLFDTVIRANDDALIGVANACDVDNVTWLRDTLNWPKTVALGVKASHALNGSLAGADDHRRPYGYAPHPQYWRRFHHHARHEYTNVVASAARDGRDNLKARP